MKKLPQISEAEYVVMKIIWDHAPISTNDITDRLLKTTDWNVRTIQTLIKRLASKGVVTYEKEGRMYVYSPAIRKKDYVGQESRSFLKRFFNGDLTAMISSFIEGDQLSDSEIDNLRTFLDQKKE